MFKSDHVEEQGSDMKLSLLLQEWKDDEPQVDFETAVWGRIRCAPKTETGSSGMILTLREWLAPSSAWVNAVAAAAGIVIGMRLVFAAPAEHKHLTVSVSLPYSDTLANTYLATVTGGQP
jgi:hypothetical protein